MNSLAINKLNSFDRNNIISEPSNINGNSEPSSNNLHDGFFEKYLENNSSLYVIEKEITNLTQEIDNIKNHKTLNKVSGVAYLVAAVFFAVSGLYLIPLFALGFSVYDFARAYKDTSDLESTLEEKKIIRKKLTAESEITKNAYLNS